jgi:hypothetical protein
VQGLPKVVGDGYGEKRGIYIMLKIMLCLAVSPLKVKKQEVMHSSDNKGWYAFHNS